MVREGAGNLPTSPIPPGLLLSKPLLTVSIPLGSYKILAVGRSSGCAERSGSEDNQDAKSREAASGKLDYGCQRHSDALGTQCFVAKYL